jgi:hypothetical protein
MDSTDHQMEQPGWLSATFAEDDRPAKNQNKPMRIKRAVLGA